MAISKVELQQGRKTTGRSREAKQESTSSQPSTGLVMPYQHSPSMPSNDQSSVPIQQRNTSDIQYPTPSFAQATQVPVGQHPDPRLALTRSFSMPDPASMSDPLAEDQGQTSSSGDRRRTKLGYARTSVACQHCRRRKIRCNPSRDPRNNKCAMCIKLHRDCNFNPVRQRSPAELRANAPTQSSSGSGEPSRSSPPGPSSAIIEESSPSQGSGPTDQDNLSSIYPSQLPNAENLASEAVHAGDPTTQIQGYGFLNQPTLGWSQTGMPPSSVARSGGSSSGWQPEYQQMPNQVQMSPYDPSNTPAMYHDSSSPYGSQQPPQWPPFGAGDRSMSFSGGGSVGGFVPQPFPAGQGEPFTRRHSDFAQPYQSVGVAAGSGGMAHVPSSHMGMSPTGGSMSGHGQMWTMNPHQRSYLSPSDGTEEHPGIQYGGSGSGTSGYPYGGG